jgi:hypothetical protein
MIRIGPTRHSFQEFAISSVAARTDAHVLSYWRMGRKSAIAAPTSTIVCMLVVTDVTVMMAAHSHPIQPHQFRPDDRALPCHASAAINAHKT